MKFTCVIALLLCSSLAMAADLPQAPNPKITPGAVNPQATKDVICVSGYTAGVDANGNKVRNVSTAMKNKAFSLYGVDKTVDKFEVDHLISLELGGANDIKNLWPQSYTTQPWNAHKKDVLENKLHRLVCSGKITLKQAQRDIAKDWIAAYNKYVK
jgi:hypothetical protein